MKRKVLVVRVTGKRNETQLFALASTLSLQRPLGDYDGFVLDGELSLDMIPQLKGSIGMIIDKYEDENVRKKTKQ